jgi:hypothetical protein
LRKGKGYGKHSEHLEAYGKRWCWKMYLNDWVILGVMVDIPAPWSFKRYSKSSNKIGHGFHCDVELPKGVQLSFVISLYWLVKSGKKKHGDNPQISSITVFYD